MGVLHLTPCFKGIQSPALNPAEMKEMHFKLLSSSFMYLRAGTQAESHSTTQASSGQAKCDLTQTIIRGG